MTLNNSIRFLPFLTEYQIDYTMRPGPGFLGNAAPRGYHLKPCWLGVKENGISGEVPSHFFEDFKPHFSKFICLALVLAVVEWTQFVLQK